MDINLKQIQSCGRIGLFMAAGFFLGRGEGRQTAVILTLVCGGIPAGYELFCVFVRYCIIPRYRQIFQMTGAVACLPFYAAVGMVCLIPVIIYKIYRILKGGYTYDKDTKSQFFHTPDL